METIIRCGPVELSESELEAALAKGQTLIISFRSIYTITRRNGKWSFTKDFHESGRLPLVARGRWIFSSASRANQFIGAPKFLAAPVEGITPEMPPQGTAAPSALDAFTA